MSEYVKLMGKYECNLLDYVQSIHKAGKSLESTRIATKDMSGDLIYRGSYKYIYIYTHPGDCQYDATLVATGPSLTFQWANLAG